MTFKQRKGRIVRQRPQWVVTAHKCRDRRPKHRDAGGYRWGKASGKIEAGRAVTVYNMTVADDHTYTVDGVVVHNCVNHSQANTQKAYEQGLSLFDLDDPDFDARVTRSERDRATANCVLHYAEVHRPRLILVECTTELVSWGPAIPGKPKIGDGSTYRWWLKQFENIDYRYKELRLNSMSRSLVTGCISRSGTRHCRRRFWITARCRGVPSVNSRWRRCGRGRPAFR
ncbi:hypothetical protein ABZ319_23690 [Nocardia sp. NPDC005978]|uniref:hypothetical protein n=1 Tax=Nocardia sp. NPDC005978 TaxID=3156725 RepID=UPI0033A888AF